MEKGARFGRHLHESNGGCKWNNGWANHNFMRSSFSKYSLFRLCIKLATSIRLWLAEEGWMKLTSKTILAFLVISCADFSIAHFHVKPKFEQIKVETNFKCDKRWFNFTNKIYCMRNMDETREHFIFVWLNAGEMLLFIPPSPSKTIRMRINCTGIYCRRFVWKCSNKRFDFRSNRSRSFLRNTRFSDGFRRWNRQLLRTENILKFVSHQHELIF